MGLDNRNEDIELKNSNHLEARISNLEQSISKEFNITVEKLKEVAEFKSTKSLDELKSELEWIDWIAENTNYTIFAQKVLELHKLRNETLKRVENLRAEIIEINLQDRITTQDLTIWNICSQELIDRCCNPTCKKDEALWLCLWVIESCATIWKTWYEIIRDTLRLPLDIVDIIRWKKEYDWFKNV